MNGHVPTLGVPRRAAVIFLTSDGFSHPLEESHTTLSVISRVQANTMNKELTQLKTTILELLHQLKINVFYANQAAVMELNMAEAVFHTMTHDQLMNHVITHILPHAHHIRARDRVFFYKNRSLFAQLPESRVEYYADYFMHSIDEETAGVLWQYFNVILTLVESYRKRK